MAAFLVEVELSGWTALGKEMDCGRLYPNRRDCQPRNLIEEPAAGPSRKNPARRLLSVSPTRDLSL
jgi:hypothetical protein